MTISVEALSALILAVGGAFVMLVLSIRAMAGSIIRFNTELTTHSTQREAWERERAELAQTVSHLRAQVATLESQVNGYRQRIEEMEKVLKAREAQIQVLTGQVETVQQERRDLMTKLSAIQARQEGEPSESETGSALPEPSPSETSQESRGD